MPLDHPKEQLVHLGLGSNLKDPFLQLKQGLQAIEDSLPIREFRCAGFYTSPPMGGMDQPDYLNTVCSFFTNLEPEALLKSLREIEDQQGRQRKEHWGARTLDIDILLYGNEVSQSQTLTLPHPGVESRDFVLVPLLEISPELIHPQTRLPLRDSLDALLKNSPLTLKTHHEGY